MADFAPGFLYSRTSAGGLFHFVRSWGHIYTEFLQIWSSDGTDDGTFHYELITLEIESSPEPEYVDYGYFELSNSNDNLYFLRSWGKDGLHYSGLFSGADAIKGFAGMHADSLIDVGGTQYFRVRGENVSELWKSDGTENGTVAVRNFSPGSMSSTMVDVAGTVYFQVTDDEYNWQLWKSDGTEAGTVLAQHFGPGSHLGNMRDVAGTLYFEVNNGGSRSLWKSDGTEAGTVAIKAFAPGVSLGDLTNVNGILYFRVQNGDLWKSDGTEAGTVLVKNFASSYPGHLTEVAGVLYFIANDGVNAGLWKSDGTANGTVPIMNDHRISDLARVGDALYFLIDSEVWILRPTANPFAADTTTEVAITQVHPALINAASASAVTISGTGEAGATVTVAATDGVETVHSSTVSVDANSNWSLILDVSSLYDGPIAFTATGTDAAGNVAEDTMHTQKDTVAPAVAIESVTEEIDAGNQTDTAIGGTGEAGATIDVTVTDGVNSTIASSVTVDEAGNWSISGIDVSALNDGTLTYTVTATDPFGNSAQSTITAEKDTTESNHWMRVSVVITDLANNPITSISVGSQFKLQTIVQDIRKPPPSQSTFQGVYAAGAEVYYDSALTSIDTGQSAVFGSFFNFWQDAWLHPGQVGGWAATASPSGPGNAPQFLFSVVLTATASGIQTFTPTYTTDLYHEYLIYLVDGNLPLETIMFEGSTLEIVDLPEMSIGDGNSTIAFALTVEAAGNCSISDINVSELNDGVRAFSVTATDAASNTAQETVTATKDTPAEPLALLAVGGHGDPGAVFDEDEDWLKF